MILKYSALTFPLLVMIFFVVMTIIASEYSWISMPLFLIGFFLVYIYYKSSSSPVLQHENRYLLILLIAYISAAFFVNRVALPPTPPPSIDPSVPTVTLGGSSAPDPPLPDPPSIIGNNKDVSIATLYAIIVFVGIYLIGILLKENKLSEAKTVLSLNKTINKNNEKRRQVYMRQQTKGPVIVM